MTLRVSDSQSESDLDSVAILAMFSNKNKLQSDRFQPRCPTVCSTVCSTECWDGQLWDRPYKAERELSEMERLSLVWDCRQIGLLKVFKPIFRDGQRCVRPCALSEFPYTVFQKPRTRFDHHFHNPIEYQWYMKIFLTSVNPFEYGDSNWRVAIKLIYRSMVQESRHDDHYNIGW